MKQSKKVPHSTFRVPHSQGFTLIEILLVVTVILMLSGMLFRIGRMVSNRSERAQAVGDLQRLGNALEEYYAVYGAYPPIAGVANVDYEYGVTNLQPPQLVGLATNIGYRYGLAAFLFKRNIGSMYTSQGFIRDDDDVKERWLSYLEGLRQTSTAKEKAELELLDVNLPYSNMVFRIVNPWGGDYKYKSHPPFLSYELWTTPPNSDTKLTVSSMGQ